MKILKAYRVESEGVPADVQIVEREGEFVNLYELQHLHVKKATQVVLNYLKEKIVEQTNIKVSEILDSRETEKVKSRLKEKAHQIIKEQLSGLNEEEENILVGKLVQEMVGLGELELILSDNELEEVVINSADEPVWVYHKKFGWLKTNVRLQSEEQIHNYASIIGRRVGRQITNLTPLMDAHLLTGNRVNATLYPISSKGNSITIRKFKADPWTIVNFIDPTLNTLSPEAAALFWLCIQYELNVLVAGGTASGKTSFLNAVLVFTPPNQRIVSIEDTRELILPNFLHWTPLVTREANPEGKGEICLFPGTFFIKGDGEMREISEYVESCLSSRKTEQLKENVLAASGEGETVLAGDPENLEYGSEEISSVSKITKRKFICKFYSEDGELMNVTDNTKVPVIGSAGKVELLTPAEIKDKDYYLPVLKKLNIPGKTQEIRIFDVFSEGDYYVEDMQEVISGFIQKAKSLDFSRGDIAKRLGFTRQALRWSEKTGIIKISVLEKLCELVREDTANLEKRVSRIKARGGTGKSVLIPKIVDENLAYFAGFVLAEKYLGKNGLFITQKDEIPHYVELVKKLFDTEVVIVKSKYNEYRVESVVVRDFMKKVFGATKSKQIRVPRIIMRSEERIIKEFLAGYIDGDGALTRGKVTLATGSKLTALEFKYLFSRLGIWSKVYDGNSSFHVNVCTRVDVIEAAKLPYRSSKNLRKADELINKTNFTKTTRRDRIPALILNPLLKKISPYIHVQQKTKGLYHSLNRNSGMAKTAFKQLVTLSGLTVQLNRELELLGREDLEFVKITKVEIIENKENIPTYDVTPSQSKYFVAGINDFTLILDTMLDLMVNSLRMRPDRIVLGEIRRQKEAEVLFEAMHTGHAVYSTLHADDALQVKGRMTSPPIDLPESMIEALHLVVVQYRQRRTGIRRTYEIAEFLPEEGKVSMNVVYKWNAREDKLSKVGEEIRLLNELTMHAGLSQNEIAKDLSDKTMILNYLLEKGVTNVQQVGKVIAGYYRDKDYVVDLASKRKDLSELLHAGGE